MKRKLPKLEPRISKLSEQKSGWRGRVGIKNKCKIATVIACYSEGSEPSGKHECIHLIILVVSYDVLRTLLGIQQ